MLALIVLVAALVIFPLAAALAGAAILLLVLYRLPKKEIQMDAKRSSTEVRTEEQRSIRTRRLIGVGVVVSVLVLLLSLLLASQAQAANVAKLRIFPVGESGDPAVDPSYVEEDPDPWVTDSWVITVTGDFASFGLNVWNRHQNPVSDMLLHVAVTDANLVTSISLEVTQGDNVGASTTLTTSSFAPGTPVLSTGKTFPFHGVYPTDFASFGIGSAGAFGSMTDTVIIAVVINGAFTQGLQVHFDASGETTTGQGSAAAIINEAADSSVRNPNSADTVVEIPTFFDVAIPVVAAVIVLLLINRRWKVRKER